MIPIIRVLYPYIFLIFCISLPLDKYASAVPNIALITLIVLFPFVVKKEHIKKLANKTVYVFAALIVLLFINTLIMSRIEQDLSIVLKIASTLLFVLLSVPLESNKKIKKAFVFSVLATVVFSLVGIYFHFEETGVFQFASGGFINEVLVLERLYLGFVCVISIIVSVQEIDKGYKDANKWYFANIVLSTVFILLISSRIALVLLIVLFILRLFYIKKKRNHIFFAFGLLLLLISAFALNENLRERIFFTNNAKKDVPYIELLAKWEPRVAIWNCNYLLFKDSHAKLQGMGFKTTRDELTNCYNKTIKDRGKRAYFVKSRFNAHNQYLDFLLSEGVLAAALFLIFMYLLFLKYKKSYFGASLVVSLILFVLIECIFHRQFGAYIFGLVWVLLLLHKEENQQKRHP